MVDTHQPLVDAHPTETHEPPSVRERRSMARMGLFAVMAAVGLVALAAAVIFAHRPHTPQITPGQKQPSTVVSMLTGRVS